MKEFENFKKFGRELKGFLRVFKGFKGKFKDLKILKEKI